MKRLGERRKGHLVKAIAPRYPDLSPAVPLLDASST